MKVLNFNGTIYEARAGSASQPGISFAGDPNTGIYSPGADQLAISTGGSQRLSIGPTGTISVPHTVTSLSDTFAVNNTDATSGTGNRFAFKSSGTNVATFDWDYTGGVFSTSIGSYGNLILKTNGATPTERLRITSAGLVGVGNSSPGSLLHVGSSAAGITQLTLQGGSVGGDYGILSIQNGSTSRGRLVADASADELRIDTAGGASTKVQFKTGSSYTNALTIDASQRVGIGTTGPSALLHVNSSYSGYGGAAITDGSPLLAITGGQNKTIRIDGGAYQGGTSTANLHLSNSANSNFNTANGYLLQASSFDNGSTNSNNFIISSSSYSGSAYTYTERLRIDSSGRLLVGTSSASTMFSGASANLQVQNTSSTFAVGIERATNDTGAGYIVFRKTRSTSPNGVTVVQSGDSIGNLTFAATDGNNPIAAAVIEAQVDGTPGTNDMPGRLVFSTTADGASSPTERMRITQAGNVLVGTTNSSLGGADGLVLGPLESSLTVSNAGNVPLRIYNKDTSGTRYCIEFRSASTVVGSITHDGTNTSYTTSSDYRLKENVIAVTDGITRLQQLKPSRFNFIADSAKTVDGFIAHEVQAVVPEAITGEKDAVDDDGNPEYQGIDQSKLVPLLTAALQEAIAKIESLEARLTAAGI